MSTKSEKIQKRLSVDFVLKNITNNINKCAQLASVSPRTVIRIKKLITNGHSLDLRKSSGRPPKLKVSDRCRLGRIVQNDPTMSNEKIANRLNENGNSRVSRFTVGRELKKMKIHRLKPLFKPLLTPDHVNQRLRFCDLNKNRDWSKVVFSDEASFQLYNNSCKVLCRTRKIIERPK